MKPTILIPLLFGVMFSYLGVKHLNFYLHTQATPQTLSLADLESQGYSNNAHLILTDFSMKLTNPVYKEKSESNHIADFSIPLISTQSQYYRTLKQILQTHPIRENTLNITSPKKFRVLLLNPAINSKDQATKFIQNHQHQQLQGIIVNDIYDLPNAQRKRYQEAYPQQDMTDILLFSVGYQPPSGIFAAGSLALSAISWTLCLYFIFRKKQQPYLNTPLS